MIKPIFVVGSGRSGTSVLTWSLGQHPNILRLQESLWISKFAVDLASTYVLGSARGPLSHLGNVGVERSAFYETFGSAINELILRSGAKFANTPAPNAAFAIYRSSTDPKKRWVDGAPLNSSYIYELLQLFPDARFIHLLRDAGSVVRSLKNFEKIGGRASTGDAAFGKWLRNVRACLEAERAFGSDVVLRVLHPDLVSSPRETISRCLDFLDEPFCEDCLAPLQHRINSSTGASPAPAQEQVKGDQDSAAPAQEQEKAERNSPAPTQEREEADRDSAAPAQEAEAEEGPSSPVAAEALRLSAQLLAEPDPSYKPDQKAQEELAARSLQRALTRAARSQPRGSRRWIGDRAGAPEEPGTHPDASIPAQVSAPTERSKES